MAIAVGLISIGFAFVFLLFPGLAILTVVFLLGFALFVIGIDRLVAGVTGHPFGWMPGAGLETMVGAGPSGSPAGQNPPSGPLSRPYGSGRRAPASRTRSASPARPDDGTWRLGSIPSAAAVLPSAALSISELGFGPIPQQGGPHRGSTLVAGLRYTDSFPFSASRRIR
ncbi:MAG: DUF308 domain-containing protein [Thermoplasmata archaeon]